MQALKNTGLDFLNSTSIKGLGRIVRAKDKGFRLMWIVGVVGLGLLCSYFTSSSIREYMRFPKTTMVYMTSAKEWNGFNIVKDSFPSMAICNGRILQSQTSINDTDPTEFEDASRTVRQLGLNRMIRVLRCKLLLTVDDRMKTKDCQSSFKLYTDILNYKCNMLRLNLSTPVDSIDLELVVYQENLMVTSSDDSLFGNSRPSGMNLFFDIDTSCYQNKVTVLPGQNLKMDFSMAYAEQLPKPYGSCLKQPKSGSMFSVLNTNLRYSKIGCRFSARQKVSFYNCGCIKTGFSLRDLHDVTFDNVTSCLDDYDLFNCSENVLSPNNIILDHCQDLCHKAMFHKYTNILSLIQLEETIPFYRSYIRDKSYEHRFSAKFRGKEFSKMNDTERKYIYDLIMNNFASVNVHFDLKEIVVYKEVPQYSFSSFIGQLGGILNLYSGISFVVIFELLDFIFNFFRVV